MYFIYRVSSQHIFIVDCNNVIVSYYRILTYITKLCFNKVLIHERTQKFS